MTADEGLLDRITRETAEESDRILGELARLMSPALRSRAEQVATVSKALDLPLPAPIAWVLDLDVPTAAPAPVAPVAPEPPAPEPEPQPAPVAEPVQVQAPVPVPVVAPVVTHATRARTQAPEPAPPPAAPKPTLEVGARRTPSYPGIEAIPEELRYLPAAQSGGPVAQRVSTARKQQDTLDALKKVKTATAAELGKRLKQTGPTEARYLVDLGRAGLVTYAGTQRGGAPAYKVGDGTPIPTELSPQQKQMPHAKDMAFAQRWTMTFEMLKVLKVMSGVRTDTAVIAEIDNKFKDMPRTRINEYLSQLADQGTFLKRVGYRRAKGQTAGRTAVEYKFIKMPDGTLDLLEGKTLPPTTQDRPPAEDAGGTVDAPASSAERPTPASGATASTPGRPEPELDLKGAELLSKHRDFAVSQRGKGAFTPLACADALGVPVAVSEAMLSLLAEQTRGAVVTDVGAPGITAYEYNETKGMGAAAQRDRETSRARSHAAAGNGGGGGDPVAGTGWDPKSFSSNAEVQRRLRMAMHKWGREAITKRGSSHIQIQTPIGAVTIGSTPSSSGLREDGKRLERAGLRGALA